MAVANNPLAPDGMLWVCFACGKTAKNRYGTGPRVSPRWDESCAMNSVLQPEEVLVYDDDGRVVRILGEPERPQPAGVPAEAAAASGTSTEPHGQGQLKDKQ